MSCVVSSRSRQSKDAPAPMTTTTVPPDMARRSNPEWRRGANPHCPTADCVANVAVSTAGVPWRLGGLGRAHHPGARRSQLPKPSERLPWRRGRERQACFDARNSPAAHRVGILPFHARRVRVIQPVSTRILRDLPDPFQQRRIGDCGPMEHGGATRKADWETSRSTHAFATLRCSTFSALMNRYTLTGSPSPRKPSPAPKVALFAQTPCSPHATVRVRRAARSSTSHGGRRRCRLVSPTHRGLRRIEIAWDARHRGGRLADQLNDLGLYSLVKDRRGTLRSSHRLRHAGHPSS